MNTISSLLKFIAYFEPVGAIKMYAGSAAPTHWLVCDGSAVSRTTYAKLFDVIGTSFGAGDGSTTFNLPNFSGKSAVGVGTGYSLGSSGGSATHTHTTANHTLTISEMPQHQHQIALKGMSGGLDYGLTFTATGVNGSMWGGNYVEYVGGGGAHNHGNTGATSSMSPYTTVNFIIFAGV